MIYLMQHQKRSRVRAINKNVLNFTLYSAQIAIIVDPGNSDKYSKKLSLQMNFYARRLKGREGKEWNHGPAQVERLYDIIKLT